MPPIEKPELTAISPPERKRIYHYANGGRFELEQVAAVCARPSGTHRLETADGRKWIVPPGWVAIELDIDNWTF